MKKKLLFLLMVSATAGLFAQTTISITAADLGDPDFYGVQDFNDLENTYVISANSTELPLSSNTLPDN